ncbi:MAG: bis(5'-nucleosyl)-tetraphosphatase (symmetrical) YqeK [Spirochaetales bacterium]|jgi:nicotinate-nucleotide adenylyltransferase|nr:bis(5'-nucleosyl)-tetraphosphatase (symmetrical) YqeK [Spirochaetales bacterium]
MALSIPADSTWNSVREKLDAFLRQTLSARRYKHSRAVAELCQALCLRFGYDAHAGYIAGLGHDAAREMPEEQLLEEVKQAGLETDAYETGNPVLLHAPVSALILKKRFGVEDAGILEAVRRHTLGGPGMGLLAKILFVADYCEPGRTFIDSAFRTACLRLPLERMIVYIIDNEKARGHEPSPLSLAMYHELKNRELKKEEPEAGR